MTKKIWLFILSFTITWLVWISFADVIEPNEHYVDRCVKLQNVEIDNYRVIVDTMTMIDGWNVYEPTPDKCLRSHYQFWESRQYLLDKSIDIDEITVENIQDKAIQIWELRVIWRVVNNSNPLTYESFTYKIVKTWDNYALDLIYSGQNNDFVEDSEDYELELVANEQGIELAWADRLTKFWIALFLTILIETIVLFFIAKIFRKKSQISNWRLFLIGILASTITLPLLRFVLPLFITYGVKYMVIGELLVILIEVFIIKYWLKISRGKAIIASILCNLSSYLLGLLIF